MAKMRSASFWDRTLETLRGAWRERGAPRPDLPEADEVRVRQQMVDCLGGQGGEVTARTRAAALGRTYLALSPAGRHRFLRILAEEFNTDPARVSAAVSLLDAAGDEPYARRAAEQELRRALEPPHMRLFTQFNTLSEGVKFLVDLRADLLTHVGEAPAFQALDDDLRELLTSWFDIGFLELRRITWESPAALLEKLIAYEAVHEISDWDDMKNRLEPDRRCFAYFHPNMPDEPLIFVEVALVKGMTASVQALLDKDAPVTGLGEVDTAIFYSISNAQQGLKGISFGNFLIKRVVDELALEVPQIKTFATLSPIPGFRRWLDAELTEHGPSILLPAEREGLIDAAQTDDVAALLAGRHWNEDPALSDALRAPLMGLAARYLSLEKGPADRALDPVAHFHLSNGARMERLNWLGDVSRSGLLRSAGMMINYLYALPRIEANHEAYTDTGKVALSSAMRALLKGRA